MTTPTNQAEKIAKRFGGVRRLAEAIGCEPSVVYRWTYPRERGGTGGVIPSARVDDVKHAAARLSITLEDKDWTP